MAMMHCQKCRTPLKLDSSLSELNPAAFKLLVGMYPGSSPGLADLGRYRLSITTPTTVEDLPSFSIYIPPRAQGLV
jgi:hypothetical protein